MRVKGAELTDKFLVKVFTVFWDSLVQGKTADCHVVGRVVRLK